MHRKAAETESERDRKRWRRRQRETASDRQEDKPRGRKRKQKQERRDSGRRELTNGVLDRMREMPESAERDRLLWGIDRIRIALGHVRDNNLRQEKTQEKTISIQKQTN